MNNNIVNTQRMLQLIDRGLLGLYFIVPGIRKITDFGEMSEYMSAHNVSLIPVLNDVKRDDA